jgi:hypothetical protein
VTFRRLSDVRSPASLEKASEGSSINCFLNWIQGLSRVQYHRWCFLFLVSFCFLSLSVSCFLLSRIDGDIKSYKTLTTRYTDAVLIDDLVKATLAALTQICPESALPRSSVQLFPCPSCQPNFRLFSLARWPFGWMMASVPGLRTVDPWPIVQRPRD